MASAADGVTALLAAADPSQVSELQVVKVMADDASLWLSVRLRGKARLALVTSDAAVESAPAADAWLHALDFATRMRVAAPPGPLASCGSNAHDGLVDTGLPELALVPTERVETVDSSLSLRKALEEAGIALDAERVARFTEGTPAPYRVQIYVSQGDGQTAAVRLREHGNATGLPRIDVAGSVPLTLIALAESAVLPPEESSADPSEFAVDYRASSTSNATCDYLDARAAWLAEHPNGWLVEGQASPALFAWTVSPPNELAPAITTYFAGSIPGCSASVLRAQARGSRDAADFVCADHDDLSLGVAELDFGELRASRLYGSVPADQLTLRILPSTARTAQLSATDFDTRDCPNSMTVVAGGASSPAPPPAVVVSDPGTGGGEVSEPGTPLYTDDGSCNVTFIDSDSCSGDSSSSDASSNDSCSGDSSSDSSDDSSGCGKSDGYDGDTCSGNSHGSAGAASSSSSLSRPPRRVHLSLLTLLAAALALPLRRLRSFSR